MRRLECDREETAAAQGENFGGQVKEAQCEVGVRRSVKDDGGRCARQVTSNNSSSDVRGPKHPSRQSSSGVMTREHENCELERRAERSFKQACCQALAKEMAHDLDVNFNDNREGIAEPRHENSGHVGECS